MQPCLSLISWEKEFDLVTLVITIPHMYVEFSLVENGCFLFYRTTEHQGLTLARKIYILNKIRFFAKLILFLNQKYHSRVQKALIVRKPSNIALIFIRQKL